MPYCSTMERSVGRNAKPLPTITGRQLERKPFTPNACNRLASAATSRLACTMMIWSWGETPAEEATIMGMVMQPTTMATTCCRASGMAFPMAGLPRRVYRASAVAVVRALIWPPPSDRTCL